MSGDRQLRESAQVIAVLEAAVNQYKSAIIQLLALVGEANYNHRLQCRSSVMLSILKKLPPLGREHPLVTNHDTCPGCGKSFHENDVTTFVNVGAVPVMAHWDCANKIPLPDKQGAVTWHVTAIALGSLPGFESVPLRKTFEFDVLAKSASRAIVEAEGYLEREGNPRIVSCVENR